MKYLLVILLVIIGLVFIALAVYYWVTPAGSLPSFVPGHIDGSTTKHFKHGLAALIVGIGCLILAWFSSGKKTGAATSIENTDSE